MLLLCEQRFSRFTVTKRNIGIIDKKGLYLVLIVHGKSMIFVRDTTFEIMLWLIFSSLKDEESNPCIVHIF